MEKLTVEERLVKFLKKKHVHISFAESMTGGLLAATLTNASGTSNVLKESYITYNNQSKIKLLHVKPETIEKFGVVSINTTLEMAKGLKEITQSDVCVAVSGYAEGYFKGEDKGLVCYTIIAFGNIRSHRVEILGTRNEVRKKCVDMIFEEIMGGEFDE